MIDLAINISEEQNWQVVILKGELDDYQTSKLIQTFNSLIDESKNSRIVLNLNEVSFIDSVGLGTIAIAGKKLMGIGGKLNIVCNNKKIVQMINLSGIVTVTKGTIQLFESLEDAISKVKA